MEENREKHLLEKKLQQACLFFDSSYQQNPNEDEPSFNLNCYADGLPENYPREMAYPGVEGH